MPHEYVPLSTPVQTSEKKFLGTAVDPTYNSNKRKYDSINDSKLYVESDVEDVFDADRSINSYSDTDSLDNENFESKLV